MPPRLIEKARRHGDALGVGVTEVPAVTRSRLPPASQPPIFEGDGHLNVMDHGRLRIAALEANTNSLGYRLTGSQGEAWAKLYNDCANEVVKEHPDRFVGMATVPLQDPPRVRRSAGCSKATPAAF